MSAALASQLLNFDPAAIGVPLKQEAAALEIKCLAADYAPGILYLWACGMRKREQNEARDLAWSWIVGTLRAVLESDRTRGRLSGDAERERGEGG